MYHPEAAVCIHAIHEHAHIPTHTCTIAAQSPLTSKVLPISLVRIITLPFPAHTLSVNIPTQNHDLPLLRCEGKAFPSLLSRPLRLPACVTGARKNPHFKCTRDRLPSAPRLTSAQQILTWYKEDKAPLSEIESPKSRQPM